MGSWFFLFSDFLSFVEMFGLKQFKIKEIFFLLVLKKNKNLLLKNENEVIFKKLQFFYRIILFGQLDFKNSSAFMPK